jgi:hypothetical protein
MKQEVQKMKKKEGKKKKNHQELLIITVVPLSVLAPDWVVYLLFG